MVAEEVQTLFHLAPKALQLRFGGEDVGTQFVGAQDYMPSFTHSEVAEERHHVGGNINQQHTAETDVVVHEAYDRAGDEPASLDAGEQERIGFYEFAFRRQLLDQRGDRWPEHPEAG